MNNLQLYLNDQLCDLSDDSPIALTYQINNLGEVKNQQGNTSKQFKLPLTQRNRRILGFPDDIRITGNQPYTQLSARIIQDGIEVVPDGLAEISGTNEASADITVISGNVDFFDKIDGSIYDMGDITKASGLSQPFKPYQHTWNLINAVASQKNTTGYIYPVIDYGSLTVFKPYTVDVRKQRPAFFLKTAIDLIIAQTGYKAKGSLLTNPLYNKLLVPFANDEFEHGTDYQLQPDTLGLAASTSSDTQVSHIPITDAGGILKFDTENSDPKNQFAGQTTFKSKQIFTAEVVVTIPKFYFRGRVNDTRPSNVNIIIHLDAPGEGDLQVATINYDLISEGFTRVQGTSGGGLQGYHEFGIKKLSAEIDMQVGYEVSIRYEFFNDRPAFFTMGAGTTLEIRAKNENVLFGQDVQCERILPDISQKDLLKDTLQRFGVICQTDNTNRTITFATFADIVRNTPIAKNWTSKCKDMGKAVSFKLGDYSQVNNLLYKEDEAITPGYADDKILINDKTLPASGTLFESQFSASINSPFVGGYVAQIKKIDAENNDTDFSISTSPRLLVDQKTILNSVNNMQSVIFTDGASTRTVNDVISTPYFFKPNGDYNLAWCDKDNQSGLRSVYYPELEKILKQTKKVSRYFMLTPIDIQELDLLIPVYLEQDNAYYYINKIDSWQKGKPVRVELIKLGEI